MSALLNKHSKKVMLDALLALGTPKAALLKGTYTYSASHKFLSDLGSNVLATVSLSGVTTDTPNEGTVDCDDITWPGVTGSYSGIWIYVDTGTSSTSPLFYYNSDPIGSQTTAADVIERIDSGTDRLVTL